MTNKEKDSALIKELLDLLASGDEYITYEDVLSKIVCLQDNESLSSYPEYNNLKVIVSRAKKDGVIEYKNGKNAKDGFRYKEGYANYFKKSSEKKDLSKKEGDEKKIFVTGGLKMLFDDNTLSDPLVDFECINELTNIELVKKIFPFVGKRVISFNYNEGYRQVKTVIMHPHLLKEYNSRWFLFGYIKGQDGLLTIENFSIDRIVSDNNVSNPIKCHFDIVFHNAPEHFYQNYFKDIVGINKPGDKLEQIRIRTTSFKVHMLLKTKPIHCSQKELKIFNEENQDEGEFVLEVIPNVELITRILSYGSGIYVLGDGTFQQKIRECVASMANNYK